MTMSKKTSGVSKLLTGIVYLLNIHLVIKEQTVG